MLDYAITGGTVVDGLGSPPRQADVGIRDGRIVAVGDNQDVLKHGGPKTRVIDAGGRTVLPGTLASR